MNLPMKGPRSVAAIVMVIAAGCALLLALPGETVTTKYMNDLFIFLDGVHRIDVGQVPNRDFHTALGPLVYYMPALGYWLSGSMGGAMPTGMALFVVALAPLAAHVIGSRLRPIVGVPIAAFLLLVAAVPINLGESIGALSFAMFYNRIGWAALGILLVMYLRPLEPRRHQTALDAACAAALILLMLYTKISYGFVGVGFLVLMLLDAVQRRWAAAALVTVVVGALAVEAVWGGTAGHIADLRLAGQVSGSLDTIDELVRLLFKNFADYVVFAVIALMFLWRTRKVRDFLFLGFCAGAGLMLISQNFQDWGIVTIAVGAAVAAEMLARTDIVAEGRRRTIVAGVPLLLLAMLLPPIVHNASALGLHAALAVTRQGDAVPLKNFDRVRLAHLWSEGAYPMFTRYMASLQDGARALTMMDERADGVLVLDFVGPFAAGLGLQPPRGDSTWHHWGRTINDENHLPADELFRNVRIVMEPKWAVEQSTAEGLRHVYADYLSERYEVAYETTDWKIYLPQPSPAETVRRSIHGDQVEGDSSSADGG